MLQRLQLPACMRALPNSPPTPAGHDREASRVEHAHAARSGPGSYTRILKSSALVGGSSLATIVTNIVRMKVVALLLGPAGIGLLGLYTSLTDFARSVASLGTSGSGVRQIAAVTGETSTGPNGAERLAATVAVLRLLSIALGALGAGGLLVVSALVAHPTFAALGGNGAIAWLSLAVLFGVVSGGQAALIQGLRRIGDLARIGAIAAVANAVATIAIVYAAGDAGIAPAIALGAMSMVAVSWHYTRRLPVAGVRLTLRLFCEHVPPMLKLGVAFMASGFLMMGAALAVRMIVVQTLGVDAAGLYQSAWTVGAFYAGFILQAMGADFYPGLVGLRQDAQRFNALVNEQAEVSALLALPGLLATIAFAPLVVSALFSGAFEGATRVLRWICLGMALRVLIWPVGFIVVAQGRQLLFMMTEVLWAGLNVGLAWTCVRIFGLDGAGVAFFGAYAVHGIVIFLAVRRLSGFRWSSRNARLASLMLGSAGAMFWVMEHLPPVPAGLVGCVATLAALVYSLHALGSLVDMDAPVPVTVRSVLRRVRHRVTTTTRA
jgi:PST family polysaccharide transporter